MSGRLDMALAAIDAANAADPTLENGRPAALLYGERMSDELARLTEAFNAMLRALAESRDRQARLVADAGHELKTPLASMRVLEKCGYTRVGRLRRSVVKDGKTIDQVLYAILEEECRTRSA